MKYFEDDIKLLDLGLTTILFYNTDINYCFFFPIEEMSRYSANKEN